MPPTSPLLEPPISHPRAPRIRHALITGGSRGIGLAIAHILASHSHRITLISRSVSHLTAALRTLPSSHLPSSISHASIPGDITSAHFWSSENLHKYLPPPPSPARSSKVLNEASRIDVLVNCAGVAQSSLLVRTEAEDVRRIVDTNLTAMMVGTRALLRRGYIMRGGTKDIEGFDEGTPTFSPVIINVASMLGVKGGQGAVAYAASKAGVIGFTRALVDEVGKTGIRVNAIVPGYISTDMTTELESNSTLTHEIPAGRFGTPEEVADAALFLVRNQYANNCVLNLDGGLSAT